MRFPTRNEVLVMRQRGYDVSTIREQEAKCYAAEAVRDAIETAFAQTSLGSGVGLYEGQAIDGYADEATRRHERARDEVDNWRSIPNDRLRQCSSSLSFFDAEGMRFHLPAFLLAELQGEFGYNLMFHLAQHTDYERYFGLLNEPQREAVRAFLLLVRDEPEYAMDYEHIDRALIEFWGKKADV